MSGFWNLPYSFGLNPVMDLEAFSEGVTTLESAEDIFSTTEQLVSEVQRLRDKVAELKAVEKQLRSSQEHFAKIFQVAPLPVAITRFSDGYYLDINDSFLRNTKLTREQVVGHSSLEQIWVYPEERARFVQALTQQGHVNAMEVTLGGATGIKDEGLIAGELIELDGEQCVLSMFLNISERKRAEQALLKSEEQYRTLARNFPNGAVFLFDQDLRFLITEGSSLREVGFDQDSLEGQALSEILSPEMTLDLEPYYRAALAGQNVTHEVYFADRIYHCHFLPIKNGQDEIYAGMLMTQDITEQKRVEEHLHRINRALLVKSRSTQVQVRATDELSLMHDICRVLVEEGGYRLAWVGLSLNDEGKTVRPLAQAGYEKGYLDNLRITWDSGHERGNGPGGKAIRSGRPIAAQNILNDPTFTPWRKQAVEHGYASCLALPLISERQVFGLITIYASQPQAFDEEETRLLMEMAEDLAYGIISLRLRAERQQVEEQLSFQANVLSQVNDAVIAVDNEQRITYWNNGAARLYGFEAAEVAGQLLTQIYEVRWLRDGDERIALAELNANATWHGESVHIRRNGGEIYVESSVNLLKNSTGIAIGMLSVIRNITERKLAEEELRQSEAKLRQSQRMEAVGRLAGGIAHDFNNLLTAINGYAGLMLLEPDSCNWEREDLLEITKAADRAASLTHQLLAFSRQQVLQPKVIDLNRVVIDLNKMLHRLIGEDIELITLTEPQLGLVMADPGQIEQVLVNLAVNARDAMPHGGKLIIETGNIYLDEEYAARHLSVPPGTYVRLTVTDTGLGIKAETLPHIFEPFFTTKEQGKGTGLGLATVYGIVKQSGGNIWVYSELDVGTTFKIYLPHLPAAVKIVDQKFTLVEEQLRGTETILLVEDEEGVRKLAHRVLTKNGYTVLQARTGKEALQLYRQYAWLIELVVTDLVMPEMGGQELVEQLLQLNPHLRLLFMSGYSDRAIAHAGVLTAGAGFLEKPFMPDLLVRKVRDTLDGKTR